jgi:hypothetical protein
MSRAPGQTGHRSLPTTSPALRHDLMLVTEARP